MHPDSPVNSRMDAQRWLKDSQASHELYNIAHLYEAGVAHAQADPASILLDVCLKNAELLQRDFGDGQPQIAPGHPGIEMALAKLYRQTADRRWLGLAKFFLDARGFSNNPYNQNHKPVIQQREAVGHAVRANYLYSGMADVAALAGDPRYLEAITAIWEDVVGSKLHLTGGCGALADGEAYGAAYELPHQCYNETCAAVGFLLWNQRMFLMTGDGKYLDVFERTLHNGLLSGVSLSGDRFFIRIHSLTMGKRRLTTIMLDGRYGLAAHTVRPTCCVQWPRWAVSSMPLKRIACMSICTRVVWHAWTYRAAR